MTVRPAYRPVTAGSQEVGSLLLRDGSRAPLWRVLPEDVHRVKGMLDRLEEGERQEVAASLRVPPDALPWQVAELAEHDRGEAFVVEEPGSGGEVVAFGAYRLLPTDEAPSGAALTLAVAPGHRGGGIGRLLLERLCVLAAHRGVERLVGLALPANEPLIDLFRKSGFDVEEELVERGGEVTGEGARDGHGDRVVLLTTDVRSAAPRVVEGRLEGFGVRILTAASLRPLFFPRSVAVVGASRDPASVGHRILQGLLRNDFQGTVFPVNPKAEQVASVKAYPSVEEIPDPVDLAVVAVPAPVVGQVVEGCGEAGVRGLVVVSAGFAETGEEGRRRESELVERVRGHGMRMVGPNCLGLLHSHPEVRLNASFAPRMPPHGSVALCSQSGALGIAIIDLAHRIDLGLSSFVSVGNKADVAADDLLEYWEEDETTRVLLFYLESFRHSRRFARVARRVGRSKPIVVVKSGRTAAGERAAGSHTAALTATDTAVDALFRQTGIVRAGTLQEMFGIARALTEQPLPPGRRFAVLTNAGGPAILCADALESSGMRVEPLSEPTRAALEEFLPSAAATGNPVDMIASAGPDAYRQAVEILLAADEVDGLVAIYTPVGMFDLARVERAILDGVESARDSAGEAGAGKPVYASVVGGESDLHLLTPEPGESGGERPPEAGEPRAERIPAFPFPEEIGRIAGKIARYAEWRASEPGAFPEFEDQRLEEARERCRQAAAQRGEGWLTVQETRSVLQLAGVHVAAGGVAGCADEAVELADRLGYPVAAKLASIQIVHKTELDAVKLDLEGPDDVRRAFVDIRDRLAEEDRLDAMQGVLIQPMLTGTAEVMIGMSQDPVFGPVLAFGMGGIHVEILRDVAFRVCPLTDRDAADMIREIRGYRLLQGYRGHPPADVDTLEEGLLRVSRLVESVEEIRELDLNPVFALTPGDGYRVADARIRVRP